MLWAQYMPDMAFIQQRRMQTLFLLNQTASHIFLPPEYLSSKEPPWDVEKARFNPWIYPYILNIPTIIAAIVIIAYHVQFLEPVKRAFAPFIRDPAVPSRSAAKAIGPVPLWVFNFVIVLVLSCIGMASAITATLLGNHQLFLRIVPWAAATALTAFQTPKTTSYGLLTIYTAILASRLAVFIDAHRGGIPKRDVPELLETICSGLLTIFLLCMPVRDPDKSKEDIAQPKDVPSEKLRSPEDDLPLWKWLSVWWMHPLMRIGNKRQLNDEDVYRLPYEFQHHRLREKFRMLKGAFLWRLVRSNWQDLVILILLGSLKAVIQALDPLTFQQFLRAMGKPGSNKWPAIVYSLFHVLLELMKALISVIKLWFARRAYERSRGEMVAMLYEKALTRKIIGSTASEETPESEANGNGNGAKPKPKPARRLLARIGNVLKTIVQGIGNSSVDAALDSDDDSDSGSDDGSSNDPKSDSKEKSKEESASSGKILNLMRSDVYEIAQRFWEIDEIFVLPLDLAFSILLIWKILGWPALLGALSILISQAFNGLIIRQMLKWERKRRKATDKKLQKITEFIQSIRHLKWEGSQSRWLDSIFEARRQELILRAISGCWRIALIFVNEFGDDMFPVLSFLAYTVIAHKDLRIDVAFPAIDLFMTLQDSIERVPDYVSTYLNAFVSVKRVQTFMDEPDLDNTDEKPSTGGAFDNSNTDADVSLESATFAWPGTDTSSPVLKDITVSFRKGLTVIRGRIGAGKSALLQALCGELDQVSGRVNRTPYLNFGYCAQSPWLQNMSIRDNILFTTEYNERRYKQVLEACALTHDLANFQHGDLSEIGENGIGLSGGQKMRVALARAVYSNAPVLLLDDPLSALDLQTAQHVVDKLLDGPLVEHRTVILVTHRVELCRDLAYQIVRIADGALEPESRGSMSDELVIHDGAEETHKKQDQAEDATNEAEVDAAVPDKFIEEEHRAKGGVQAKIYWQYVKAGKLYWWAILICFIAFARTCFLVQTWFLKQWGEAYDLKDPSDRSVFLGIHLPPPQYHITGWLLIFFFIGFIGNVAYVFVRGLLLVVVYIAGKQLFENIMYKVSGATWRYYDVTPIGRLMNRMTGDVSTIDGNLSQQLHDIVLDSVDWMIAMVAIASTTPVFLVFAIMLFVLFAYFFYAFLPTSQSLRRLEMVSLSPLISNFGSLQDGITTIRAFKVQHKFQNRVIDCIDTFQKNDHFYWSLQAWLMFRLDVVAAGSSIVLLLLAIYTDVSPGLAAFVMVNGNRMAATTRELCEDYGRIQMDFVSVERVIELLYLDQEDPGSFMPPAGWPSYPTEIIFDNVSIRYAEHMDPALKNVSLKIPGGKNTAIIGRTGSGKSTLASSILGTVIAHTGKITIQGIDVAVVDKQTLRRRVTFLPQDPLLLPGSMRHNLDPLEEFSDDACASVLARVGGQYGWTLETKLETGGRNLSQGQRQLVGLARAVLRQSAVVIFDEATASIDSETALHLVRILREELQQSTIITIAHRLETIQADYFIELENGQVAWEGDDLSQKDTQ